MAAAEMDKMKKKNFLKNHNYDVYENPYNFYEDTIHLAIGLLDHSRRHTPLLFKQN